MRAHEYLEVMHNVGLIRGAAELPIVGCDPEGVEQVRRRFDIATWPVGYTDYLLLAGRTMTMSPLSVGLLAGAQEALVELIAKEWPDGLSVPVGFVFSADSEFAMFGFTAPVGADSQVVYVDEFTPGEVQWSSFGEWLDAKALADVANAAAFYVQIREGVEAARLVSGISIHDHRTVGEVS